VGKSGYAHQEMPVLRSQKIFTRSPQQPHLLVARPKDHGHRNAAAHDAIWDRSVGLNLLQRVSNDFFYRRGVAKDEWQNVLQRVARRALKSKDVLIHVSLRKDVLLEKLSKVRLLRR